MSHVQPGVCFGELCRCEASIKVVKIERKETLTMQLCSGNKSMKPGEPWGKHCLTTRLHFLLHTDAETLSLELQVSSPGWLGDLFTECQDGRVTSNLLAVTLRVFSRLNNLVGSGLGAPVRVQDGAKIRLRASGGRRRSFDARHRVGECDNLCNDRWRKMLIKCII